MMSSMEEVAPISRYMKYALVRNHIEQNGEYRRKLAEIGREHKRKAGEILQGRSQAVRDHVISSYQAAQRQASISRSCTRTSISRDRTIMSRITDVSNLLTSSEKIPAAAEISWNSQSTSIPKIPLTFGTISHQPISGRAENSEASRRNISTQRRRSELNYWQDAVERRSQSSISARPVFTGTSQRKFRQNWEAISPDEFRNPRPNYVTKETNQRQRSYSGSFSIKRRSREFSISSMALLRLQQIQQSSRLDPTKKIINYDVIEDFRLQEKSKQNQHGEEKQLINNVDKNFLPSPHLSIDYKDFHSNSLPTFPGQLTKNERTRKSNLVTGKRKGSRKYSVRFLDKN